MRVELDTPSIPERSESRYTETGFPLAKQGIRAREAARGP